VEPDELPPPDQRLCWWSVECRDGCGERRGCQHEAVCKVFGFNLCRVHAEKMQHAVTRAIHDDQGEWFRGLLRENLAEYSHGEVRDLALSTPVFGARTVIYFVARYHLVKIGYATDLRSRLRAIEQGSSIIPGMAATPVELLASFPGDRARERELHDRFRHLCAGGEWFLLNDELEGFIKRVKENQS
jgi:hypothetical protein